jgi:RNA polymerase sigma factor for flagellar operon FliA
MQAHPLFEANAESIERAIVRVCRDARLDAVSAEDFASSTRLSLLEDDCAILRKFEGRSSMATYLTIVVRRLLVDARRAGGRWYASHEAQRRGAVAVQLERLMLRDRRPFAEAAEVVRNEHPEITVRELEQLAAALPERAPRPVLVPVGEGDADRFVSRSTAADLVEALDVARRSTQTNDLVRGVMAAMTPQDRLILRLRFSEDASIASIARAMRLEQRPLYRRIEALLASLRRALEGAGIDAASAGDLIGTAEETLDFGLERKIDDLHPSHPEGGS